MGDCMQVLKDFMAKAERLSDRDFSYSVETKELVEINPFTGKETLVFRGDVDNVTAFLRGVIYRSVIGS